MKIDFTGVDVEHAYKILSGLVTPRPIALVTTLNQDGGVNAAPFSFFNVLGDSPPIVGFCPGDRSDGEPKDTALNVRQQQQFVVHMVDAGMADAMNLCAASLAYGESEVVAAGLTLAQCEKVKVPRIEEAPVALECENWGILEIGHNRLVIGKVLFVHCRSGILKNREQWDVDASVYQPIGRMQSPNWYTTTTQLFQMQRPE